MGSSDQDTVAAALEGRYTLERELGRGGMATVYLAADLRHGRRVAVKVLHADLSAAVGAERFAREITLTAGLVHPHILPVFDSGAAPGVLWYAMPYIEGETLRDRIRREGPLPIDEVLRIGQEVADALEHAHHRGIVHRDVKPENILLAGGHALLMDFGIARAAEAAGAQQLTSTGLIVGTPTYMSPEQVGGEPLDGRSDQYSLACVMYEMLAGEAPFTGPTAQAIIARRFAEPPRPIRSVRPQVGPELEHALLRGLATVRADRHASMAAFSSAIAAGPGEGSGAHGPRAPASRQVATQWRSPRTLAAVAALAGLIVVATALARRAPEALPEERSIAVLPLANTSGNPADAPLFDGITDELIGALGSVRDLRVVGRTSVFALRDRALDARAIGDTLGVATVLEGSGRREGNRLKVRVQLVSARDGRVIWGDAYDREMRAALAVQEEIARAIVAALRIELGARDAPLVRTATSDSAAYELYLRGRYVFNTDLGPDGIRTAVRHFEDAISRDSALAPAFAGLSDARARLAIFGYGDPRVEIPLARAAALRALEIDSSLAAGHAALGHVLCILELDWSGGERALRRAVALDPGYVFARPPFAVCLASQGRFAEAKAQLDSARVSDPLAPVVPNMLGRVYVSAGQPDSAIAALREALSLDPRLDMAYQQLGHAYVAKGMYPEAIAALERAAALSGPRDSAHLAWAYAAAGRRADAERILAQVLARPERRGRLAFHLAMAYAALGNRDTAFELIDRSFREHSSFLAGIAVTPAFAVLHGDPRWRDVLRRLGLPEAPP